MTKFLDKSFSVPMPGDKGEWPWDEEKAEKPADGESPEAPDESK